VTPSATALLLTHRLQKVIFLSGVLGLFAAIIGIHLSIIFNTTPGPAIVIVSTSFYGIAVLYTQITKASARKNANRSLVK
ncbi:MAG: metal ABC transporter permease, partial [Saprospiraceae bacterium]